MYRRSGQDAAITSVGGTVMPNMLTALDCVYLRHIMDMLVGVIQQADSTPIAQDNNACIFLVKGSGMYNRAKYIDARIYRIREKSESGRVKLYKVAGQNQPADIFTKSLPRLSLVKDRHSLMGELPTAELSYILSLYLFLYDFGVHILCAMSLLSEMMG